MEMMAAGADKVFIKPFDAGMFWEAVNATRKRNSSVSTLFNNIIYQMMRQLVRFTLAHKDDAIYLLFVVGAALNFLPQILGFSLKDPTTGEYPDFLTNLASVTYVGSLTASLASTFPIVIDYVLDLMDN
eukprot:gene27022-29753_t